MLLKENIISSNSSLKPTENIKPNMERELVFVVLINPSSMPRYIKCGKAGQPGCSKFFKWLDKAKAKQRTQ
jgi:hypothetical protein